MVSPLTSTPDIIEPHPPLEISCYDDYGMNYMKLLLENGVNPNDAQAQCPLFAATLYEVTLDVSIVSGYSATYRMETAHSCFSWNDRTIGDVVKKLCEQAKVQLELNPAFKETKDFICQYEESDFDFIRRLAHQYQEWMYFDGTKLIFGKPRKLADPIRLEYGTTLSSLDIGLQTLARSEQVFSYHSGADREMQRMTPKLGIWS